MADSLKAKHAVGLYSLMAANLAVFYALLQNESILNADWLALVSRLSSAMPAGVGVALTGFLSNQLTADAKARIVFLRWDNPYPGSEAFSKYMKSDPRIDVAALKTSHGPFPKDRKAQNAFWYKLYRSVESEPAVAQVHSAFLFARDCASLALLVGGALGLVAVFQFQSWQVTYGYLLFLVLHFVLARRAASNHGRRFVTTVLALKSAGR